MRREPDGLVISLREVGFFESGSNLMKTNSEGAFDRIAELLRKREYRLRIEGHTDNVPIHTSHFPSNWELSTARATEIVRLLIVREGFGPNRLSAAGYADYHPLATNATAEGRGINRRVDIVILGHAITEAMIVPDVTGSLAGNKDRVKTGTVPEKPSPVLSPAPALVPNISNSGPLQR